MKNILFILLSSILLFGGHTPVSKLRKENKHIATCYGNKNCYACKNCKYCGHCNAGGGTCGICSSSASLPVASQPRRSSVKKSNGGSSASSQCQGITKKGARCKRMVRGGGYCFQHS